MAQRWARLAATVTAAVAGLAGLAGPAVAAPVNAVAAPVGTGATRATAQAPAAHGSAVRAPGGRVVVIGIPGLRWSDLDPERTPTLWRMTGQGSAGALSVRTTTEITCPVDGWLTLSAGQRARLAHGTCALPPEPVVAGPGSTDRAAYATGFARIQTDNRDTPYEAQVGSLGGAVQAAGGCTLAVGPGAVYGAADTTGRVDRYAASVDKVPAGDWTACALTVVDVDAVFRAFITAGVDAGGAQVPVSAAQRSAAVATADRQVGQVRAALPQGTTVLVAGLSDTVTAPHLRVALAAGGGYGGGYLTASSTRQPGIVTLTDVTTTALRAMKVPEPAHTVGSPWQWDSSGDATAEKVRTLNDEDVAAQAIRRMIQEFFIILFGGQLLVYALATVALRRRWGSGPTRRRILGGTRLVALAGAAAAVSTFLANLLPWWHFSHPLLALIGAVLITMVTVTGLSVAGPWRRSIIYPGLVISGLTALVLGLDVMTGSQLQMNAFMGYNALVAGRFYGFSNMGFALFAVSAIMSAAWLAERPLRADRRRLAVGIVLATGVATMVVDGWPGWGSDFGGVLATVPAFAVLTLMVAGKRVSVLRVGLFCVAGALVVLAFCFVDSLRAEPTHLGRFWDQLINGEAWGVIGRKAEAMLKSLGRWQFTLILLAALGFLFFVLARPVTWRAALLGQTYTKSPTLRPALLSAMVLAVVGTLVNDSGVVISAMVLSLAVPLTLAASVRVLELDGEATPTSPPEREAAPSGRAG